jgi:DNA-binding transcriptional LysR family regulator
MDALTLDQFSVFLTVANEGSFAAAARRLNRAQSAITYTIQKLEEQSGVALFDRSSYRPVLTEAGRALLPRAKQILDDVDSYRRLVRDITNGLEASLTLAIDAYVPSDVLLPVLVAFGRTFPSVELRVRVEPLATVIATLRERLADLGLLIEYTRLPEELGRSVLGRVELVPVAAPIHPLARIAGPCDERQLRGHTQLVLGAGDDVTSGCDDFLQSLHRWHVNNLETIRELILAGIGWGCLPRSKVSRDLEHGTLVELRLERWDGADQMSEFPLVLAYHRKGPLGHAAQWLLQQFKPKT